jgi:aldehyde dehydrogenase (NAD+)
MPISISPLLEGGFPAIVLRYMAGVLKDASFEEERPGFLGGTNIVRREPIGVVGAIVPWNYPQTLGAFKYGWWPSPPAHRKKRWPSRTPPGTA